MDGKNEDLNGVDWRFNEFPNPSTHALYVTCVELMTLGGCEAVGESLLDVILRCYVTPAANSVDEFEKWTNAVGLMLAGLPHPNWVPAFHRRVLAVLESDFLTKRGPRKAGLTPFDAFNARKMHPAMDEDSGDPAYLLAVAHAVFTHVPVGYFDVFHW
jgi:mediator of RNA polymerase II transcription subunit 23